LVKKELPAGTTVESSRKSKKSHPRFQIRMNYFMGNPPDVKSLFPEFFCCGTISPEKNSNCQKLEKNQ
jgi:hypothetical protein